MKTQIAVILSIISLFGGLSKAMAQNGLVTVLHADGTSTPYVPNSNSDTDRGAALLNAVSSTVSGDIIFLSENTYDIGTGTINLANGGNGGISLIGRGMHQSVIISFSQVNNYQCIIPGKNCLLSDFQIVLTNSVLTSISQYPISVMSTLGQSFDITNLEIRNIFINANSDGIYFQDGTGMNSAYVNIRGIKIRTQWHAYWFDWGHGSTFNVYDSDMRVDMTSPFTYIRGCQYSGEKGGATANVYNTTVYCTTDHPTSYFITGYRNLSQTQGQFTLNVYGGEVVCTGEPTAANNRPFSNNTVSPALPATTYVFGTKFDANLVPTATPPGLNNVKIYSGKWGTADYGVFVYTQSQTASFEQVILANGNITITLPDATQFTGKQFIIKKTDSGTTSMIVTTSSQTIDGATSLSMATQYQVYTVASDGNNWYILSKL